MVTGRERAARAPCAGRARRLGSWKRLQAELGALGVDQVAVALGLGLEGRIFGEWRKRGGDPADPDRPLIIAKMNSLEDKKICQKLYDASQVGVRIKLIVRGFCCLRPGVTGLSDNITVISVIGRFLEHSRIWYFHNAGKPEYFIGSADWMYRNLNTRVECVAPIVEPALQARLKQILDIMLADQRQAWDMGGDGVYVQRQPDPARPETIVGTQRALMDATRRESVRT